MLTFAADCDVLHLDNLNCLMRGVRMELVGLHVQPMVLFVAAMILLTGLDLMRSSGEREGRSEGDD